MRKGDIEVDEVLDVKGEKCPVPVIQAKMKVSSMEREAVLKVVATDPGSGADIKVMTKQSGLKFLGVDKKNGVLNIYIKK